MPVTTKPSPYGGNIWTLNSFTATLEQLHLMLRLVDEMDPDHVESVIDWLDHRTNKFDDAEHVIRYMETSATLRALHV